ncbi:response regulator [Croceivirga lutea]|uniref:response regulator n=1 Tax=Croceivirga lutea TaxID=1775167 RepID=UPI00163AE4EC|nr:response regulator [Croceivirga lutea]GGG38684.1 response regulator [Croceivirga lutea]
MLKKILLVDDNKATNFIHTKFVKETNMVEEVVAFQAGENALDYLVETDVFPEIIFVDINMPTMDAWEFLDRFNELARIEKENTKVFLLTTTISPTDEEKVKAYPIISKMMFKPLDVPTFKKIVLPFL